MAITVEQQPDSAYVHPAWNLIEYIFSSTNTAQSGFKIVAKLYRDPAGTNELVKTWNLETRPGTTDHYLDIALTVRSFIEDTYSVPDGDTVDQASQDLETFRINYQEYYSDALQGSAANTNIITVSRQAFPFKDWLDDSYQNYQIDRDTGVASYKQLLQGFDNTTNTATGTTAPTISAADQFARIMSDQRLQIRHINKAAGGLDGMRFYVALYDSSYSITHQDYIAINTNEDKIYSMDCGPGQLSAHTWVGVGFTPASDDKYMAIWIVNGSDLEPNSAARLYQIDWTPCEAYTNYEVHWLNRYGGFDSWVFTKRSKHDTMVMQSKFKNQAVPITSSATAHKTHQRRVQPFHTQLKETWTMNTRNLRQWEYEGMRDLLTSPEIYILIDSSWYSITLTNLNRIRNYRTEESGVFNMTIEFEIDLSEERQW